MLTKIIMILFSYFTGKLAQHSQISGGVAALSAETLRKILTAIVVSALFLIGISMSLLLVTADLLIQQHTQGLIVVTPTLIGGLTVFLLCLVSTFFVLKPNKKDKRMNVNKSENSEDTRGSTQLAEAFAELVRQYTEERRVDHNQKMKPSTGQESDKVQAHLKKVREHELTA